MSKVKIIFTIFILIWILMHFSGINYGTESIPMHQSYVGDEQSPVNGALHILSDESLLGLKNVKTVYYGPVLSVIALPGIVADFGFKYLSRKVHSSEEYKNSIIWDWGGIIFNNRLMVLLFSVIGLILIYKLFLLSSINTKENKWLALICTVLIAFNYYFFQYSHFFKHWIFILIIFIGQIYLTIRMYETGGKVKWHWWLHGLLGVLAFGISYFILVYEIAFIPFLYQIVWKGDKQNKKYFAYYALLSLVGFGLMIFWHPYAFIRLIGLAGIGEMAGGLNNANNPFVFSFNSFGYYLFQIIFNQLPIILITAILSVFFFIKKGFKKLNYLWIFYSVAIINFLLFALAEHHEGRYMLPTIIMIIFGAFLLFFEYLNHPAKKRLVTICISLLFAIYFVFHTVHIFKWIDIWSRGPEEKIMIENALKLQEDGPVLLVQNYIAGQPHTKVAYRDYTIKFNKSDFNLYKEILAIDSPKDILLLNAYYVTPEDFKNSNSHYKDAYKHIIYKFDPRPGEINQFDYMDENILRLWWHESYSPSYFVIK